MPELLVILAVSTVAAAERFYAERRYIEERYRLLAIICAAKVSDATAAYVARMPFDPTRSVVKGQDEHYVQAM